MAVNHFAKNRAIARAVAIGQYEPLHPLKGSTVFKAKVLSSPTIQERWDTIKTAATEGEKMCLTREYQNHGFNEIASSPFIRALCDTIRSNQDQNSPSCLVFEWMDQDVESVTVPVFRGRPILPKVVSKAVLSALSTLKTLGAVHTDVSPNNIFVSNVEGNSPVAKLGDLSNMIVDGSAKIRVQSLPARAPEVWHGIPCRHSSDVWSFAATVGGRVQISYRRPEANLKAYVQALAMRSLRSW
ncbi:kinase-like domain-containing protein [Phaeosphaeria sp. MPI-PUGE-AT-0046c]|nr:kinase-like domain-containing protein [Phaeosphaeria sp. MPI-PUGE-AT-0046c]